jgi:hypothetical protein
VGWRNLPTLRVGWRKKKDTLRPEKKDTVVCLLGARFWRLRPEKKKDTVVCLAGCAVVLFFVVAGNFDYDQPGNSLKKNPKKNFGFSDPANFLHRHLAPSKRILKKPEKKSSSCLSGRVVLRPEKKKFQSSPERLRPENKKVQVVIKFVLVQLEL